MLKRPRSAGPDETPDSKRQRLPAERAEITTNIDSLHNDMLRPIAAFVGLNDLRDGTSYLLNLRDTNRQLYQKVQDDRFLREAGPTILAVHYTQLLMTAVEPAPGHGERRHFEQEQDQIVTHTARLRRFMPETQSTKLVDAALSRDDLQSRAHGLRALSWTPAHFTKDEQTKIVRGLYDLVKTDGLGAAGRLSLQAIEGFRGQLKELPDVQPSEEVARLIATNRRQSAQDYEQYKDETTDIVLSAVEVDRYFNHYQNLFAGADRAEKVQSEFGNLPWGGASANAVQKATDYISSRFTLAPDRQNAEAKLSKIVEEFNRPAQIPTREMDPRPRTEDRSL